MFQNRSRYSIEWKKTSKLVRKAFGWKCALCATPHGPRGAVLTVHHIDCNRFNNDQSNLIALCFSCHVKVDLDAEFYFLCQAYGQQELFPEFNYLSAMKKLWLKGVQRDFFENTPGEWVVAEKSPLSASQMELEI